MQVGLRLMKKILRKMLLRKQLRRRPMTTGRNYGLALIPATTRKTMPLTS